jgi:hypothetical protein
MAPRKPAKRRVNRKAAEDVIAAARGRLSELPTSVLLEVHDLLERLLNADELDERLVARLRRLLAQRKR